ELALAFTDADTNSCASGWTIRATYGGGVTAICERVLKASSSVNYTTTTGNNVNYTALNMADYGTTATTTFQAGWEFYVENATSPCSLLLVIPQVSVINTAYQNG